MPTSCDTPHIVDPASILAGPGIASIFKLSLGAFGPTFSTVKLVGLVNNCKENEPFFLALATAVALAGKPPVWGVDMLYLYCACRFVHALVYLVDFPEALMPFQVMVRATPYLASMFAMFRLAASVLLQ